MSNLKHLCVCASLTDEYHGYKCEITDGACMFLTPNQDACAERFGEVEHTDRWNKEHGVEKAHFRTMECEGCICDKCEGACTDCVRCYRAEYAEKDWDDYYRTECEAINNEVN